MATPEGQAIIRELAKDSDIVVENFKTGGLQRYGLDYASLAALNPRLIYCSVTGFGHTGPYAPRAGYDLLIQAMSGLMSITGRADSEPGGGPLRVGVAVIDLFTGMYATSAILSALEARHHTGRGQHIDMALLDVAMAVLANQGTGFLNTGSIPGRQGNTHPSVVPYQDFPTADGNMLLAIGNDGQFARFCEAAGVAWHQDARFTTNAGRVIHRVEMVDMMSELTAAAARPTGSRCWKPAPCPAAPSTTSVRPLKTPGAGTWPAHHAAALPGWTAAGRVHQPGGHHGQPLRLSDTRPRCVMRLQPWASTPRRCCVKDCSSTLRNCRRCATTSALASKTAPCLPDPG
jgi:crotonobetainyl-CoA:carnitine CoA-transferase CaiB-like acyl-CoA transferase